MDKTYKEDGFMFGAERSLIGSFVQFSVQAVETWMH